MSMFAKLSTWWSILVHHAHAGTLPDPPTGGNGIVVQPVNPHVVTPEAPAAPTVTPVSPAAPAVEAAVPVGTPPHPISGGTPAPGPVLPPHDDADSNGLVALNGVGNADYDGVRHAIKEIADALPTQTLQRASAELNVGQANGEYIAGGFIGVAVQCEEYTDTVTGAVGFRVKQPTTNIPQTRAWPPVIKDGFNLAKVQGVTGYLNSLAVSG